MGGLTLPLRRWGTGTEHPHTHTRCGSTILTKVSESPAPSPAVNFLLRYYSKQRSPFFLVKGCIASPW